MENISEEEFCLKRKNFEAILSQSFSRFRDQSLFFDCTVATEDDDGILILQTFKLLIIDNNAGRHIFAYKSVCLFNRKQEMSLY